MTTIYLVRHAHAKGNQEHTFQGHTDGLLTDLGYQQLDCLAEACKPLALDRIYTSPLTRAFQTAEAINRYHGLTLITDDGLKEIDMGDWEGQKWENLQTGEPELFLKWSQWDRTFCAPNGEPLEQVYVRMRDTLLRIVEKEKSNTICIVSHGCSIAALLAWAAGDSPDDLSRMQVCHNTAISRIEMASNSTVRIAFQNDYSHLKEELLMQWPTFRTEYQTKKRRYKR